MIRKSDFPILEFDNDRDALITPQMFGEVHGSLGTDKLIISFFKDAINTLLDEGKIVVHKVIKGENDLVLYKFVDDDVLLMHGIIGCAATGGYLDELTGCGIKKVMFCGGGGVLDKNIEVGELLVVEGAIRDEGFSYHYIEPTRIVYSQAEVREKICSHLTENGVPYTTGIVWTTDAFYRETREKIALRKAEGARIVEMEQAGCLAVAQFRGIKYGAIIYGGDDVSGSTWDSRMWRGRGSIRYNMIEICKNLVKDI